MSAAGAAAVAAWAPAAHGQAAIVGGTGGANVWSAAAYQHTAGTVATMTWVGGGPHNATATTSGPDKQSLFRSGTISSGTTPVGGSQYLAPGSYPFICTIHPSTMRATLNVAGTPLPRPKLKLRIKSGSFRKALAKRKVLVKANLLGGSGERAKVDVRLGKTRIGKARTTTRTRLLAIKLTKRGVRKLNLLRLKGRSKAKLKAVGSVDFGKQAGANRVLK